jgi:hypothetical protein
VSPDGEEVWKMVDSNEKMMTDKLIFWGKHNFWTKLYIRILCLINNKNNDSTHVMKQFVVKTLKNKKNLYHQKFIKFLTSISWEISRASLARLET